MGNQWPVCECGNPSKKTCEKRNDWAHWLDCEDCGKQIDDSYILYAEEDQD
ncbi:MAG: hypothetical protein ACOYD7_07170 [Raoultibacter sp.]|jgi:hypothetical protein